jgi:lipid II:glycine glycyltransferase (peptidoglycan interpeptide bridge formation enzyme)
MIIRDIREDEKDIYNSIVHHPLQTWEWGEFRKTTGLKVERIGFFDQGQLKKALQLTFHPIPLINKQVGYFPKGEVPDEEQISVLKQLAKKNNALFIKIEPNIFQSAAADKTKFKNLDNFLEKNDALPGRPLFTKYSFVLDLTQSEEKIFANLASKTRYNTKLAAKKGVQIFENSSKEGLEQHLTLLKETTNRQNFYAHTPDYFRKMWQSLGKSNMMKVFNAVYENKIIASWIIFIFDKVIYYPYGASSNSHREVMASNLLMWEMIRYGKKQNCTKFDMWGSLGPNPDKESPFYGFHRFKKGYGGELVEFIGSYDVIMNHPTYKLFRLAENLRWKILRIKAKLSIN